MVHQAFIASALELHDVLISYRESCSNPQMSGDMTEPLTYSWSNHKHCVNATTCLVSAAGCCLEPGARQLAVCACKAAPGDRSGTGLAERVAGVQQ